MAYGTQTSREDQHLQPPQSLDAEQAVLGSVLRDAEALSSAIEVLPEETFFYFPKHQMVYRAMLDLYERSEPCDITTVADALLTSGLLEKVGGRVYLVELAESVATTANITSHANIVLEKALLRRLINTSNDIVRSCYMQEGPVGDLLDMAESNIFGLSEYRLRKGFTSISSLVGPLIEQIEEYHRTGGGIGVKTGFTELDTMTNGLQNGDLVVVAGRPSMGKTAFALNIADHVSRKSAAGGKDQGAGMGVGIFSLEMSQEALALRMLSSRARVSQQKIRSGRLSNEEWQRLPMFGGGLSEANIWIDDSPSLTPLELRAKARRLKTQHNIGLIMVDYIQMMHASGRIETRQQEIALVSRNMKSLAKELDIPVIAISQLSRLVETRGGEKRPQLADLRESGAIEQDADVVILLYRPEFYFTEDQKTEERHRDKLGMAEIIVAKQRNGPTGSVWLTFLKEYARFENPDVARRELPPDALPVDGDVPF